MARISGIDLPREKRVEIGLTYIWNRIINFTKNLSCNRN
ncbi:ribosomal protein S13 [Clostridium beijerinckii]|nr:ribosomal protein S13 [Clostridium beijerinckii]